MVSHRLGKHLGIGFLILLFFLQFAEFNLKTPRRLRSRKRCIIREFPFSALRRHLGAFIIKTAEIPLVEM